MLSDPVATVPGNAGAPGCVPLKLYTGARGDPVCCSACSYAPRSAWSYMTPVLARSTVVEFADHATPTRGPQLFLSMLKLCDAASGASLRPSGYRYRSYRRPYSSFTAGAICQSSCTKKLYRLVSIANERLPVISENVL